jgi:hypothetical protein
MEKRIEDNFIFAEAFFIGNQEYLRYFNQKNKIEKVMRELNPIV